MMRMWCECDVSTYRYGYKDDLDWAAVNYTKALMTTLQCRSLQWVFDNVMPNVATFRDEKLIGYKLTAVDEDNMCLEINHVSSTLVYRKCSAENDGRLWDLVRFNKKGFIRVETKSCLDHGYKIPTFHDCHFGNSQKFEYNKVPNSIKHFYHNKL